MPEMLESSTLQQAVPETSSQQILQPAPIVDFKPSSRFWTRGLRVYTTLLCLRPHRAEALNNAFV